MNRTKGIIYTILAMIPVGFGLFLLATISPLLLLLGIVAVLAVLLALKRWRPGLFVWLYGKKQPPVIAEPPLPDTAPRRDEPAPKRVYMVLTERESFDGARIAVNKESFSIGREEDNDYVLGGDRVSRHHLKIDYSPEEDVCFATDLNSANGTYFNSTRMKGGERYMLLQGDSIMIDDRPFTVEYAHY